MDSAPSRSNSEEPPSLPTENLIPSNYVNLDSETDDDQELHTLKALIKQKLAVRAQIKEASDAKKAQEAQKSEKPQRGQKKKK